MEPVQQQRRGHSGGQLIQRTFQILYPRRHLRLLERIVRRIHLQLWKNLGDIHRLRCVGFVQRVLMSNVTSHSEKICFRAADDFVLFHPHQAQKYFLGEIRNVGGVARTREQETTHPIAILGGEVGYERFSGWRGQFQVATRYFLVL